MQSEVTRNRTNLEVSVALDTTGSMAGSKITALMTATNNLIDLIVKDVQTPTYSKMAIVPWSFGANVGTLCDGSARSRFAGPGPSPTQRGNRRRRRFRPSQKPTPASSRRQLNHGFSTGDYVYLLRHQRHVADQQQNLSDHQSLINTTFKLNSRHRNREYFILQHASTTTSGSGKVVEMPAIRRCEVQDHHGRPPPWSRSRMTNVVYI